MICRHFTHDNKLLDSHRKNKYIYEPQVYNMSMKDLGQLKTLLREQAPFLEEKYGAHIIGIFGSYVRDEQRSESDLDILIELDRPPKISLIGLVELEHYLSDVLGVRVDIAIKKNLKKRIGERILREVIQV